MKRKLITLLTLCIVLCASIFCLTSCNETPNAPAHSHVYNNKVAAETYLASNATCLQKAKYYFSCECGDVGSVTFEHGNYAPHVFENYTANSDAKCGVNATETAACEQNGCSKTDTREIVDSALEHEWSAWSSNGNNTHTRTCLHNSAHTETKDCTGGEPTTLEQATCADCGGKYGHIGLHTYSNEYSFSGTHHWLDATCGCDLQKDYAEHTLGDDGYCSVCAAPVTDTAGILYDTSADGTYAEVIGYEGTAKKIRIADTYNNLPVKSIYNSSFKESKITSVIIPDSVTTIGSYAFYACHSLTSVTIGNSVTYIGSAAFSACSSLTSVTIPDSVTYIGSAAFYSCKYTVSENINYIGDENNPYAILVSVANKNFSTYTINENTKYICDRAFKGYSRLSTITIPDSVTSIGDSAFSACSSLTSVTIGNSVESIGSAAFSGCTSLTSVTIPDSVTTIGFYAFYECTSLTSVTIGDRVTTIGDYAFRDCSSLTSVTIGDSVTTIGDYAFRDCSSLTSVTIGDSVTTIGDYAFCDCSSLETIYCRAESKPSGWHSGWIGSGCNAQVVWGYKG